MMTGFERYTKKTRRAMFLEEMEQVIPWAKLCTLIEPHYPKPGNGRRPKELEKMLRIYFLQQWFNLADPAVEEALYDSATLRQFAGIDLGAEPVPDETTVCKFRHLLEEHNMGEEILGTVNLHLQAKGVRITTGTIDDVDRQTSRLAILELRHGDAVVLELLRSTRTAGFTSGCITWPAELR